MNALVHLSFLLFLSAQMAAVHSAASDICCMQNAYIKRVVYSEERRPVSSMLRQYALSALQRRQDPASFLEIDNLLGLAPSDQPTGDAASLETPSSKSKTTTATATGTGTATATQAETTSTHKVDSTDTTTSQSRTSTEAQTMSTTSSQSTTSSALTSSAAETRSQSSFLDTDASKETPSSDASTLSVDKTDAASTKENDTTDPASTQQDKQSTKTEYVEDTAQATQTANDSEDSGDEQDHQAEGSSSRDLSGGAIAGIVVGVVVFVAIVVGAVLFWMYKKRKGRNVDGLSEFVQDYPEYHPPVTQYQHQPAASSRRPSAVVVPGSQARYMDSPASAFASSNGLSTVPPAPATPHLAYQMSNSPAPGTFVAARRQPPLFMRDLDES
ncbi:hypothetical protein GGI07_005320 [Coemansia sp. Benny D115]|nr:hypothetical protein GGI07_005320 [Coemansia sp. Benny D115]